ncbi:MAG: penicillin-binding transpeptidase domain-containing protein, partial [Verrucomicrobiota bacterium]
WAHAASRKRRSLMLGFAAWRSDRAAGSSSIRARSSRGLTWFASYGPYQQPRYAVVVMVEGGGSGGGTCAPVARRIYEHVRDRERGGTRPVSLSMH